MNFPLYLKIEQKQTNKQNTSLRHVSDKEKCTALLKIGSILRKERNFYFVKVEEKDKFLGDFSLIWPYDVLNCNKQPLSVHRYQLRVTWDVDLLLGFDLIPT